MQSDLGFDTIVNQLSYGFTFLVGALCAFVKRPSPQTERVIAFAAVVLMTLCAAAGFMMPPGVAGRLPLDAAAGIAGALGGAMWTVAYVRIDTRLAVPYGFASLSLGSVAGWALSFGPHEIGALVSVAMPALAFLCWQRAVAVPADVAHCTPCYDREPATTYIYVFGGLVVFSFALGISRGFPAGQPVVMDALLRTLHQWGVVAVSLALIWWSAFKRRQVSFSLLWRIEICLVAVGVVILTMFPGDLDELAVAVINIADTLMLGVLWVTAQDASRHSSYHPFAVFGFAWAARVLARDAGRFVIGIVGTSSQTTNTAIGVLVLLISLSVALLLSNGIPRTRAFFSDDRLGVAEGASQAGKPPSPARTAEGAPTSERRQAEAGDSPAEGPASATNAPAEASASQRPLEKGEALQAEELAAASVLASADHAEGKSSLRVQSEPASAAAPAASAAAAPRTPRERLVAWMADERNLTQREIEVALLIATGRSKAVIAKKLFVSENTVRTSSWTCSNPIWPSRRGAVAELGPQSRPCTPGLRALRKIGICGHRSRPPLRARRFRKRCENLSGALDSIA